MKMTFYISTVNSHLLIGLMRIISERVLDVKEEMCLCFVDWQKASERVDWTKLLEMLRNIGVNWRERRLILICNLYMRQRIKLHLNQGEIDCVKIGRGVRQGSCMSPVLLIRSDLQMIRLLELKLKKSYKI